MSRSLTIKVDATQGTLTETDVFIKENGNYKRVIASPSNSSSWTGNIGEGVVEVKFRVWGIGNSKFKITLDLPGTAKDLNVECSLNQGYYAPKFII